MYGYNKDTFVEQLVKIEPTAKTRATKIAIWVTAVLLTVGLIFLSVFYNKFAFVFLLLAVVGIYGAYYLCSQLNVEYEYIITNGTIDIDCIINQQKRQRMASFMASEIEVYEKYNATKHKPDSKKRVYFGCTPDSNCAAISVKHPKGGVYTVVLNLNDEFKEAIKRFADYSIKKCID